MNHNHLYVLMNHEPGDEDDAGTPDAAAAAAAAAGEAATDEDKPSPFRQGVEKAARIEQGPDADEPDPNAPDPDAPAPDADKDPKAPIVPPEDDEAAAAEAKKKADEEFSAGVDAEVKDLGLKGRTETRFREMATKLRERDEQIAEYEAVKEELPTLRASAEAAEKWEDALYSVGADQEQFGRLLGYAFAINKGSKEQLMQAREALTAEMAFIDKKLGIKSDAYNPLDEHEDLKGRVESGDLDEADALALAAARRVQADQEKETADQKAAREATEAREAAVAEVKAFEDGVKANDPQYRAKLKILGPHIELVASTLHPTKWKAAIEKAYKAINLPNINEAMQRKPPVSRQPVRGGPSHQQVEAPTKANAFRFGVDKAKKAGM